MLLFIPLLPLGQNQKDHKIDEQTFEAAGWNLHNTVFKQGEWHGFAQFLTQHPANPNYRQKNPNQISWVLSMRMLRNIVAHESRIKWASVTDCLKRVVAYTSTRQNFRELISAYEQCIIP